MAYVINDKVVMSTNVNAVTGNYKMQSTTTSVVAQLVGSGAISAVINVYGGIYDEASATWLVKNLDATFTLSGTNSVAMRQNLTTLTKYLSFEVASLTGTNAVATVGFINTDK